MAIAIREDAGLPRAEVARFSELEPTFGQAYDPDASAASRFFAAGQALLDRLPPRPRRSQPAQAAADELKAHLRSARVAFLRRNADTLYARLTRNLSQFVRVEELVYAAAGAVPGLVPTRDQIRAERELQQKDKEGHEVDQGLFLSQVLSQPRAGGHLVHAMLRPRSESIQALAEFQRLGRLELGATSVVREGAVGYLYHGNPRYLNAEDDSTTSTLEIGTDLILLDPAIDVGVIRGKVVEHPRYAGLQFLQLGIWRVHRLAPVPRLGAAC